MRRLACLGVVAAAVMLAPAALASTTITNPSLGIASTACSSLRTSVGAATFSRQYATLGACATRWAASVATARKQARASCGATGLGGACVVRRTTAAMERTLAATAPTMRHCSALLNLWGTSTFVAHYGGASLQSAFGGCASPKSIQSTAVSLPPAQTYALTFTASPTNGSGVSAEGSVVVGAEGLVVSSALFGAEPGHTHGLLLLGRGVSCPATGGVDNGGAVAMSDGSVLVGLDAGHQSGVPLSVDVPLALGPALAGRTVVVLGKSVNGGYDAAYPIACGTLSAG